MSNAFLAAKKDGDDLVLDVFSVIGRSWDGEGVTAKAVAKALADSPKSKRIVMRINSPGGDVFEGNTIVSLLKSSGKAIRTEVHGLAASMGSVLALAGDEIMMADGAMMMIHNPWGISIGDAKQMRKRADLLDKLRGNLLDTYMTRANISREKVSDMMDAETWMTATEAIKNGFADSVMSPSDDAALASYRDLSKDDASQIVAAYRNAAPQVAAQTVPPVAEPEIEKMPETEINTAVLAMEPAIDMVPRADYDALAARFAASEAALKDAADKAHAAKVDAALTDALKAGKIVPASEAYHRTHCATPEGLAAFQAFVEAAPSVVAPLVAVALTSDPTPAVAALTENQKRLCAEWNISEDDFRAAMKVGE